MVGGPILQRAATSPRQLILLQERAALPISIAKLLFK